MANCRDIEPKLAAYVDRDQPAADRLAVEAHLRACPPAAPGRWASRRRAISFARGARRCADVRLRDSGAGAPDSGGRRWGDRCRGSPGYGCRSRRRSSWSPPFPPLRLGQQRRDLRGAAGRGPRDVLPVPS